MAQVLEDAPKGYDHYSPGNTAVTKDGKKVNKILLGELREGHKGIKANVFGHIPLVFFEVFSDEEQEVDLNTCHSKVFLGIGELEAEWLNQAKTPKEAAVAARYLARVGRVPTLFIEGKKSAARKEARECLRGV